MEPDQGALMKKVDLDIFDPALEPDEEKLHRLARISVGMLPIVGVALLEVLNSVLESPLNKRRAKALNTIGEAINELIEKGVVTEEGLQNNDVFISTVAQACNVALRHHEDEKIQALKNAVKNTVIPGKSAGDYSSIFMNFVDTCSTAHIALLHIVDSPEEWLLARGVHLNSQYGTLSQIFEIAFPTFHQDFEFYETVWSDLYRKGLVKNYGFMDKNEFSLIFRDTITPLGSKLIRFLS